MRRFDPLAFLTKQIGGKPPSPRDRKRIPVTQQSGGQLRIYSEVGQGTTLGIYLTRYYGAIEDETVDGRIADLLRFKQSETVLIVNDKPTVRMLISDILEDLGDSAIEAGDSATIPKERQSDVRVELLTTDVGLPSGMNGRQMAEAARSHRSQQIHHIGRKSLVLRATCERTFSASAKGH